MIAFADGSKQVELYRRLEGFSALIGRDGVKEQFWCWLLCLSGHGLLSPFRMRVIRAISLTLESGSFKCFSLTNRRARDNPDALESEHSFVSSERVAFDTCRLLRRSKGNSPARIESVTQPLSERTQQAARRGCRRESIYRPISPRAHLDTGPQVCIAHPAQRSSDQRDGEIVGDQGCCHQGTGCLEDIDCQACGCRACGCQASGRPESARLDKASSAETESPRAENPRAECERLPMKDQSVEAEACGLRREPLSASSRSADAL